MRINKAGKDSFAAGIQHLLTLIFFQHIIIAAYFKNFTIANGHGFCAAKLIVNSINGCMMHQQRYLFPKLTGSKHSKGQYKKQGMCTGL